MKKIIITITCALMVLPLSAQKMVLSQNEIVKLQKTQITGIDFKTTRMEYPRLVGYNSRKGLTAISRLWTSLFSAPRTSRA